MYLTFKINDNKIKKTEVMGWTFCFATPLFIFYVKNIFLETQNINILKITNVLF